jgi:hypothetical protein
MWGIHAKRDGEICRDEHQVDKGIGISAISFQRLRRTASQGLESLTVETIEIRRMLCGLRRKVLGDDDQEKA